MSILAICRELAALIEPDREYRDDVHFQPSFFDIEKLYIWPEREEFVVIDTGGTDEEQFRVQVAWAADRRGEADVSDPDVTESIIDYVEAMAATVRANRAGDNYEGIHVEIVDYEVLTMFDARGFQAAIAGYQIRSDA